MTKYVETAVNVPQVSGVFHYHLPPELEGRITPGHLVVVPFGAQTVQGVVLRYINEPEVDYTKAVESILDEQVVLTPAQIKLAQHLSESTLAPLAACVGLMIPVGVSRRADTLYIPVDSPPELEKRLHATQQQVLKLLQERGPLRGRQIEHALPRRNWQYAANKLVENGVATSSPVLLTPRIHPRHIRTAQLSVPPEMVLAGMQGLSKKPEVQARRQRVLRVLATKSEPVDVNWVYAEMVEGLAPDQVDREKTKILNDLVRLNQLELVMLREEEAWRDPLAGLAYDPSYPPQLTIDQQKAWQSIHTGLKESSQGRAIKPFLLHGVTGSGKTELYLRAVAEALKAGKQAIVLVPEIALTPQTIRRFMGRFPGRVGVLHSGLSDGERYDTWRRARQGKLSVIIGPRSALFAPLPGIGVIVVDEAHDDSYYQENQLPYYHARSVAVAYARITGAVCILGTATPNVTSYYQAKAGRWQLLDLPARILAHKETVNGYSKRLGTVQSYHVAGENVEMAEMPPVHLVDMRAELVAGNRSIFSMRLQNALKDVLDKQQQAILFLNRRGTATYVFCRDCGHVMHCPRCDTSFTYHIHRKKQLFCHHCGYSKRMPPRCPQCDGDHMRHYGSGTERVEEEVKTLLPEARTLRWDYETTRQKGAHEIILNHFSNHRADVLVGTQMLAKGLDLPYVTLVGVILADVGLHLPDYRATERVFQVLTQVAGRAGRSPLGGQVVLQTFSPENYVIQAAAKHDYLGFMQKELDYRQRLGYPPYTQLVRLLFQHTDEKQAAFAARGLARQIKLWIKEGDRQATDVIGPVPAFYTRLDGYYRWQIVLRGPQPATLLEGKELGEWKIQVNPQSLL